MYLARNLRILLSLRYLSSLSSRYLYFTMKNQPFVIFICCSFLLCFMPSAFKHANSEKRDAKDYISLTLANKKDFLPRKQY